MSWFSRQFGYLEQGVAHATGAVEDFVGAHDAAKATRSLGDQAAADQGVQVGEKRLGETEFPNELVHGDPDGIEKVEQVLTKYAHAYERIGEGLRGIDAHDWQGKSADKFRATRDKHAKDWHKGADSYQQAASAMQAHRHTVIWGQKQAGEAIRLWNQAKQERKDAADSHNEKVKQYNEAAAKFNQAAKDGKSGKPPAAPGEFQDPSGDTKAQATAILKHAREQVHTSNGEVKSKLDAACDLAPPIPPKSVQKKQVDQAVHAAQNEPAKHMLSGLTDSVSSTIGIVRGGMPFDPYNMTHPSEYADHMSSQAAGMVQLGNHPSRLVKSIAHEWKSDPAHAAGELVGDLVGGGGAGGVAKTGAKVVGKAVGKEAAKTAGKAAGKDAGKTAGKEAGKEAGRAGEHAAKHGLDNAGRGLGKIGRELRDLDNRMHDPGKVDRGQADTPPASHHQAPPKGPRHQPDPNQHTFDQANRDAQRLDHDLQQRYRGGHDPHPTERVKPAEPAPQGHHTQPPKTHATGQGQKQQLDHTGQNLSRIEKRLAGLDEHMHDSGPTERVTPHEPDPSSHDHPHSDRRMYDPKYEADSNTLDQYLLRHRTSESTKWLDKTRQEWPDASRLHDAELLSLRDYTSSKGVDWNKALRGGHDMASDEVSTNVRALNSALNKLPDHSGQVQRVIDVPSDEIGEFIARHRRAADSGEPIIEPNAQSTSQGASKFPGNVEYQIESHHGKDTSPINPKEKEVTFPPGERMYPVDVRKDHDSGRWVIKMTDGGRK